MMRAGIDGRLNTNDTKTIYDLLFTIYQRI